MAGMISLLASELDSGALAPSAYRGRTPAAAPRFGGATILPDSRSAHTRREPPARPTPDELAAGRTPDTGQQDPPGEAPAISETGAGGEFQDVLEKRLNRSAKDDTASTTRQSDAGRSPSKDNATNAASAAGMPPGGGDCPVIELLAAGPLHTGGKNPTAPAPKALPASPKGHPAPATVQVSVRSSAKGKHPKAAADNRLAPSARNVKVSAASKPVPDQAPSSHADATGNDVKPPRSGQVRRGSEPPNRHSPRTKGVFTGQDIAHPGQTRIKTAPELPPGSALEPGQPAHRPVVLAQPAKTPTNGAATETQGDRAGTPAPAHPPSTQRHVEPGEQVDIHDAETTPLPKALREVAAQGGFHGASQPVSSGSTGEIARPSDLAGARNMPGTVETAVGSNRFLELSASPGRQIIQSLRLGLDGPGQVIDIRLHPSELGSVRLTLQQVDGEITGIIQVDQAQTKSEIEKELPEIIASLQENGVSLRRLEVVTSQHQQQNGNHADRGGGNPGQMSDWDFEEAAQGRQDHDPGRSGDSRGNNHATAIERDASVLTDEAINVYV